MSDAFVNELETEAREHLKEVRAYRLSDDGKARFQRARVALSVMGIYVRLRATMANERTNELVEKRMNRELDQAPEQKRLSS